MKVTVKNSTRYGHEATEIAKWVIERTLFKNSDGLVIKLKNSTRAISGMTYYSIPRISPEAKLGFKSLITVKIGPESSFPTDNLVTSVRWVRVKDGEPYLDSEVRSCFKADCCFDHSESYLERRVVSQHPYGGKKSPLIQYRDWREGLVALLAHELRHFQQFQNGWPKSEVDAETSAARRLEEWRAK